MGTSKPYFSSIINTWKKKQTFQDEIILKKMSAPSNPSADHVTLYYDTSDNKVKIKNSSGTILTLDDFLTSVGFSDLTGTLANSQIPDNEINQAKLLGSIPYSKLSLTGAILNADLAGSIAKSKVSSTGTWTAVEIPNLAASKITSGTFDAARIPTLAQSKITNLETDLSNKQDTSEKAQANGYASLDSGGDVPLGQLGNVPISGVNFVTPNSTGGTNNANARYYSMLIDDAQDNTTTEADVQHDAPFNFTASKLFYYLETNTISVDIVVTIRINGADGNETFTVPASTTGLFQDTTNTDNISAGDLLAIEHQGVSSGTGNWTCSNHGEVLLT